MNITKFLWILVGLLSFVIVSLLFFLVINRDTVKINNNQSIQESVDRDENKETEVSIEDTRVLNVSASQKKPIVDEKEVTTPTQIDWQKEWQRYLPNTNFIEMNDITGDEVPEVLVSSFAGQGGSGTNVFVAEIFTLKNGKPVQIDVYLDGLPRTLSVYSGNTSQTRVYFSANGIIEEERRGGPGVYETLVRKIVYVYNQKTLRLESSTKTPNGTTSSAGSVRQDYEPSTVSNNQITPPSDTQNTVFVVDNTLSQLQKITSWNMVEDFVFWKNYYSFNGEINDRLKRSYPDGQMITLDREFDLNSAEQKNTVDAIFSVLNQNKWKPIIVSYATPTDLPEFDHFLYEKNGKPLVLMIEKSSRKNQTITIQLLR